MAPTVEFLDGFEYGVLSSAGGGIANAIVGTIGTTIAIETTIVRTGGYSLKLAPSGAVAAQFKKTITTRNQYAGRLYFYVTSLPATSSRLLSHECSNSVDPTISVNSDGTLQISKVGPVNVGSASPVFTSNEWHRLDYMFDVIGTTHNYLARIDGGTEFGGTTASTATNMINFQFGRSTADPAMTVYIDDLLLTTLTADYPLGMGEIRAIRPIADGTHTNPASFTNDAAAAIGGAGGTAFQYLDEAPWTTNRSDYVTQTVASSTDELRVTFGVSYDAWVINGVWAWYALDSSTTGAFTGGIADIYSSTTQSVIKSGDWSNNIWEAYSAKVTPNAAPWTNAQLNALEARMGHVTAQPANPRWSGIVIQYDMVPRVPKTSPYPQLLAQ